MDIHQIQYLITIVDNDFNLTKSARVLNVSQPALSKLISELENVEQIQIFTRGKGRITGLTPTGEDLIKHGRTISQDYNDLLKSIHERSDLKRGTVKIGIAPVIISTVFNRAIPKFIQENPQIDLQIVEKGAYELQKKLILQEIDLAVLVSPATYPSIQEKIIYNDSVAVWFNKNHRFNKIKGPIPFEEVAKEKIVTLDDSFMVTFQTNQKFSQKDLSPNYFFKTSSWDLILNICQEMDDTVGIIASPIGENYAGTNIEHRDFDPKFPWSISLCNLKDVYQNAAIKYTQNWFIDYFKELQNK
ncbi:putative HTH-type transcriptional regulator [Companilactobacillus crustorum]|uniref:HTH-type transcriptional regulator n=3 Tax=Companilactobacillus TaxID=2767879 RepID=A0A837RHD5_9LACO|nr:LysR family transcriptional regulator [Companilactobacillus crustorum]HCD07514.1 LysR family transcriptional regulator [Lactobacillus sp.]KRK42866.1 HTH-type transcriptional regulator [Companilactobacillus crustorum JCM 15951]KRO20556.1 HTH-type transcriptional regulator [Companilactobacillus crustorum]WDT65354.1 LysR family transcriptional regulator [Companilactobacillus crustorum]GEO76748.1 putative HTH-type transcriptional regulator [Companilactobacillus crustorum]